MQLTKYNQYTAVNLQALDEQKRADILKNRILPFEEIETIEDAKLLAKKILPINQEYTSFYSGFAKCTIINKDNLFRISLELPDEFICYDFT